MIVLEFWGQLEYHSALGRPPLGVLTIIFETNHFLSDFFP